MSTTKEIVDMAVEAIRNANGGLSDFQIRVKKRLNEEGPGFLDDPAWCYFVGKCAESGWYNHTERWRSYLSKRSKFSFKPVVKVVPCHCTNHNNYYYRDPKNCHWCHGSKQLTRSEFGATYGRVSIDEIGDKL